VHDKVWHTKKEKKLLLFLLQGRSMNAQYFCIFLTTLVLSINIHGMNFVCFAKKETISKDTLECQALYHAELGNSAVVKDLLTLGVDPNTKNNTMSLLHYAVRSGNGDMVNMLLNHPDFVTTNIANNDGSPFCLALEFDYMHIAKRILSVKNIDKENSLYYATKFNKKDLVSSILFSWTNPKNLEGSLLLAAERGYMEIARVLLSYKPDVNYCQPYNSNYTPLHAAANNGHTSMLRLLLGYNAQIDKQNKNQETPLHVAIQSHSGNINSVKFLIDQGACIATIGNNMPLAMAMSSKSSSDMIELLLTTNIDVNGKIPDEDNRWGGHVILSYAIALNRTDIVHILLTHPKIKINEYNRDKKPHVTPLDIAYFYQNAQMIDLLIQHGGRTYAELKEKDDNVSMDVLK